MEWGGGLLKAGKGQRGREVEQKEIGKERQAKEYVTKGAAHLSVFPLRGETKQPVGICFTRLASNRYSTPHWLAGQPSVETISLRQAYHHSKSLSLSLSCENFSLNDVTERPTLFLA